MFKKTFLKYMIFAKKYRLMILGGENMIKTYQILINSFNKDIFMSTVELIKES